MKRGQSGFKNRGGGKSKPTSRKQAKRVKSPAAEATRTKAPRKAKPSIAGIVKSARAKTKASRLGGLEQGRLPGTPAPAVSRKEDNDAA